MKRILFVDLGHSSLFQGAEGLKNEVVWTRRIASFLDIDPEKWDVQVVPDFFFLCFTANQNLVKRIEWINKRSVVKGSWVLSIHGNASVNRKARGITTCFLGGSEYMRSKALELSNLVSKRSKLPLWLDGAYDDRLTRNGRLGMVRDTLPPALLLECGFVSNADDVSAKPELVAKGISAFFNAM